MELKVENLIKSFEEKRVIKGADYSFEKGKIYGLLGRNGAGKTTLFNLSLIHISEPTRPY